MSSVCRICLAGNTPLHLLKNNELVDVYERLSKNKFHTKDSRPRVICHCCYRNLKRCHTIAQMIGRSEKIFSLHYDKGLEVTHEDITQDNLGKIQLLPVETMQSITIDDNTTNVGPQKTTIHGNTTNASPQETIKHEELMLEQDTLLDDSAPEDGIEIQLILEDNSDEEPHDSKMPFLIKRKLSSIRNSHAQLIEKQYSHTKQYTEETSRTSDKIIHDKKKLFPCHLCDKKFNQKGSMTRHMRIIHTGPKPLHSCNVCDKQFNLNSYLVKHMKIHTAENKQFACNICDKQFSKKGFMTRHMRIHTGEKPLSCNVCYKQTHRKKPFAYNLCDKKYIDRQT